MCETLDALAGAIESALARQRHEKSREQGVSPDTAGADQGPGARSSHIGASDPEVDSTLGIPRCSPLEKSASFGAENRVHLSARGAN